MRTSTVWALLRFSMLALVPAQAALAQAVAESAPIVLQGSGPYHRLTLPSGIYARAGAADLRDVRVRNGAGLAVPFAWADDDESAATTASRPAPLFALPPRAPGSADETLGLRLRTDGTITLARPVSKAPSTKGANDWIIDARQVEGSLLQASFTLGAEASGLFPFTLEASDDLRGWRPVAEEQLVRLQQDGRSVERLAVELDHVQARFLRLRWRDPANAPTVTSVTLDSVLSRAVVPAIEWSEPVVPSACGIDYCDYPAPRGVPLQSLRIALAQPNTLAAVQLVSIDTTVSAPRRPRNALYVLRHGRGEVAAPAGTEQPLANVVLYRLQQPGGEARSAALALDGAAHTLLRLRTRGPVGALGQPAPTLSFGSRPRGLVFLAQGPAPFTLTWSSAAESQRPLPAGALTLGQLMPDPASGHAMRADVARVTLEPLKTVAQPAAAAPAPQSSDGSRKPWLWAALVAGLLLLGGMAWSLFRGLEKSD